MIPSWNELDYDWSPDGKWLVYAQSDSDFNRDIWLLPVDGSRQPFNLSRHPYNDGNPVWSPDGRLIAFTGRRGLNEVDIHYVWLRAEDDEKSGRERTLEKALEKINKVRNKPHRDGENKDDKDDSLRAGASARRRTWLSTSTRSTSRIQRIAIPDSTESGLFWSPDSKKLAFTATVAGQRGTYTVEIPDDLKPKLLTTQTGSAAALAETGQPDRLAVERTAGQLHAGRGDGGETRDARAGRTATPRAGQRTPTAEPSAGQAGAIASRRCSASISPAQPGGLRSVLADHAR